MWDPPGMRNNSAVTIALMLAGCANREQSQHDLVMDRIEQQVQLPKGAHPLSDYARIYLAEDKDQVVAVYILPQIIERAAANECSELTKTDNLKTVPCVSARVRQLRAGERRWVSDHRDLPFEVAPGCEVITLAYDLPHRRFDELSCVGNRPVSY